MVRISNIYAVKVNLLHYKIIIFYDFSRLYPIDKNRTNEFGESFENDASKVVAKDESKKDK